MTGTAQRERAGHSLPKIDAIEPGEEPVDLEIIARLFQEAMKMVGYGASPNDAIKRCLGPALTHLVAHMIRMQNGAPLVVPAGALKDVDAPKAGRIEPLSEAPAPEAPPVDEARTGLVRATITEVLDEKGKVRWDLVAKANEDLTSSEIQNELAAMHAEGLLSDPQRGWYGRKE